MASRMLVNFSRS